MLESFPLWHNSGKGGGMKLQEQELINEIFDAIGNPVNRKSSTETDAAISFYYRNNPDGSIRWIWPVGNSLPVFLKFYNIASSKAKLLSFLIRLAFRLKCQKWFASGTISLGFKKENQLVFERMMGQQWAIFTGTAGVNRTALFYGKGIFYKIPVGTAAKEILTNEFQILETLNKNSFVDLRIPDVEYKHGVLLQTDVFSKGKQLPMLTDTHWNSLYQLAQVNNEKIKVSSWKGWEEIEANLEAVEQINDDRIPSLLVKRVKQLKNTISKEAYISVGLCHGDFTPWNMKVNGESLSLIDWELYSPQQPLFFDSFHFIYQQAVLVDHVSNDELDKRLANSLGNSIAWKLKEENAVDLKLHYQLYLLYTISYYLERYSRQDNWHIQINWSFAQWQNSISKELVTGNLATCRELVVQDMFEWLKPQRYAALKWVCENPDLLSEESDIDFCVDKATSVSIKQYLKQHPLVNRVRENRKSFMSNYSVLFKDHGFLSIDAIWNIKRKDNVMVSAENLLDSAVTNPYGVKVPSVEYDFLYTWLFYLLNHASVPERYQAHFKSYPASQQQFLENRFVKSLNMPVQELTGLFHYKSEINKNMNEVISRMPENKGISKLKNKIGYLIDTLKQPFSRKGFVITFSGVDGAGKSTVIENVKHQIEKKYRRKVVVLRHRPALLPMLSAWKEGREAAEQKAAERLPRQGKNKSLFSSLLRFGYYYADYLLGQFVVHFKYVRRGYVVLYDRYYFDFINDGKRSNIVLPAKFTSWWYAFLLKPRYNFFLYADAETILKRKKEMDAPTIKALTKEYITLFNTMGDTYTNSKYIPIQNEVLSQTLHLILQQVKTEAV